MICEVSYCWSSDAGGLRSGSVSPQKVTLRLTRGSELGGFFLSYVVYSSAND